MDSSNGRVLVADDSITVRKVIERVLQGRGWQVLSAQSGADAIAQIEREHPDLVISDVVMPDKTGYDICDFVRKHPVLSATPVILISGMVTAAVRERAAAVRSSDVMGKPFSAEELTQKVETLLRQRSAPVAVRPPPPAGLARRAPPKPAPAAAPANASSLDVWAQQFLAISGVRLVIVVDRQGLLIDVAGADAPTLGDELPAALASCLAESSQAIGRTLGTGALDGMILEYEQGVVLARYAGSGGIVAIVLRDPAFLGKVRYLLKRALPEIESLL